MSRNYIARPYIATTLRKLINDLNQGRPIIYGTLRVAPGHDYWWFLEYGTGIHFQEPEPGQLAPNAPPGIELYEPEGSYDITVQDKPLLVYVSHGHTIRAKQILSPHPGVKPLSIVRTALFTAHIYLKEQLGPIRKKAKRRTWAELPTRKKLVELVNETMEELLLTLRFSTPDNNDPNPYHEGRHPMTLAEAWRVTKAR